MNSKQIGNIIAIAFHKGFEMGVSVIQDPTFELLTEEEIRNEVIMNIKTLAAELFGQEKPIN